MEWSDTVDDYYPVFPRPRWGHGRPPHSLLQAVLERSRTNYERALAELADHRSEFHCIGHDPKPNDFTSPFWDNHWFGTLDAASLVGFLISRKPRRYLEIGSGHSTMFARHAVRAGSLATTITSIDPQPRANIDLLCDRIVRKSLEDCELSIFEELQAGDILFFDGSHRVFMNSDVTVFFLEVLPKLKPGILVHVHDVFLPFDYTPIWNQRLYSEQYLLAAMLLCPTPPFQVILPNYFVCNDPQLSVRVREIFRNDGGRDIPFIYRNGADIPGVSFWLETSRVEPL